MEQKVGVHISVYTCLKLPLDIAPCGTCGETAAKNSDRAEAIRLALNGLRLAEKTTGEGCAIRINSRADCRCRYVSGCSVGIKVYSSSFYNYTTSLSPKAGIDAFEALFINFCIGFRQFCNR